VEHSYIKRYVGRLDVHLSPNGKKEARWVSRSLKRSPGLVCWSSPLIRARETAKIAFKNLGKKIRILPDLREINFGKWEGMTFEEIRKIDPQGLDRWFARGDKFKFPEGDSIKNFHQRIRGVIKLIKKSPAREIMILSHGGLIRTLLCFLLGMSTKHFLSFDIRYASIAVVRMKEKKAVLQSLSLPPKDPA